MAGAPPMRRTPARNASVIHGNGIPAACVARKGSFHATAIGNSPAIRKSPPHGEKYGLIKRRSVQRNGSLHPRPIREANIANRNKKGKGLSLKSPQP